MKITTSSMVQGEGDHGGCWTNTELFQVSWGGGGGLGGNTGS